MIPKSRKSNKEEFCDPTVYFSMVVSTEVRPHEIIDRIAHEWACLNGSCLQMKDLQSISSETVVIFFKVSTATPKHVILAKLKTNLLEAQKRVQDDLLNITTYDFTLDKGILDGASLPEINFCVQNALLRGQEVTAFNKLSHWAQQACKSWHLEVNSQHVAKMKGVIQCAKEYGCVEEVWGIHAHLSKVTEANTMAHKAKQQVDVAQSHTNYQLSMVAEELVQVVSLDEPIDIIHLTTYKIVGSLMLRTVLFNYLKMKDGYPLIAEVHRENLCKPTHVIIPQTKEAERMIGMMNRNLPVFLYHMLLELDFTEDIVKSLLKKSCEASLVADILNCKWQSDVRALTTLAEER